ncbi:class I SAM-dependent methyltransferase [Argonema antarcticum]|uniref:class I SAM-dependent methyltransferase n=1 Tax=Argonema antarcticum TaxID=2942763 RepID=UPI002010E59B|nr:class I SAM-dependent methyltransferase [Argonema antarcticum]
MEALKRYIIERIDRRVKWEDKDILAMQYLAPLSKTYLPWTIASMRPSGLVKVLNDIVVNRRSCIVECGGGLSTYYIASLIKERGGHLYTIEHDRAWVSILKEFLATQNLDKFVSIICAPLAKSPLAINDGYWYDQEIIRDAIAGLKIDLLLVDGPPAHDKNIMYARYPAAPYFKPFMSEDYTIILDDINRKGEQEILRKWEKELAITFYQYQLDGSIAIAQSKNSWLIA